MVGNLNGWSLDRVFSVKEMLQLLKEHFEREPLEKSYRGEVAERYRYVDDGVEVGFISFHNSALLRSLQQAKAYRRWKGTHLPFCAGWL